MISHPFTFSKHGLKVEFNYQDNVIPCKMVRISLNKKTIELSREEFSTLMAVFADDKQMEDIFQTKKTDFVSIERMLKLKLTKDMKEGENLVFPYTFWIPKSDYEQLKKDGEMVKLVEKGEKGIIDFVADNEAAKNVKRMWSEGKLTLEELKK